MPDEQLPAAGDENGSGTAESEESIGDSVEAARSALSRARAAARAKGLRPGLKPRRRTKDVPVDRRSAGRDPQLLGDQLDQFVAERGWGADVAVGAVIGRWPQIVGPEVSQHCEPIDYAEGVLTVRADSTAWATQLRLLSSSLLGRLAEDVGEGTVTEMKVVGPAGPSWKRGSRRVQDGRGPRDTYG
ncbi:DUF721 domain-containing protein [Oryzobacter telluris]|uniref:DUF721 domain-containing protein n=1 Tax=Oryzobacter telluris TaxID=3149179 RepID=UPI00370D63EB